MIIVRPWGKAYQWGYRDDRGVLHLKTTAYASADHALRDAQIWSGRDVPALIYPAYRP